MQLPALNDFNKYYKDDLWIDVARHIAETHRIPFETLIRADHGENIVFMLDDSFIVKIYTPLRNGFNREKTALEFAYSETSIPTPKLVDEGQVEGFYYLIMSQLQGNLMARAEWLKIEKNDQIEILCQLAEGLKEMHSHNADDIEFGWKEFIQIQKQYAVDRQAEAGASPEWLGSLPAFIKNNIDVLPTIEKPSFLHGDVHFGNLRMMNTDGKYKISGLFDFADSLAGFHEYDFLAPTVLMIQGQGELQREFFRSYGYADADINEELRRRLMVLTVLYECSNLKKYAERLDPKAVDLTLDELEKAIWNFV